MEIKLNKALFKSQAKKQFESLKNRNIALKLSDVQESLAAAYGHANLATLYASFAAADYRLVEDTKVLYAQPDNLFVFGYFWPEDDDGLSDEEEGVFPPGTALNDVMSRDWGAVETLRDSAKRLPDGIVFGKDAVALHNYALIPRPDRYGLPDSIDEKVVNGYMLENFTCRIPKNGVTVDYTDSGDDGGTKEYRLMWLNNEDSAKIRALFA